MSAVEMTVEPIDLTLIIDPAQQWPDPESCPDWPLMDELSARMNSIGGPQDAQSRLATLERSLNRAPDARDFKMPTQAEKKSALDEHFAPSQGASGNWRWDRLGFAHLIPRRRTSNVADMIVEAAHIRGYLRKLEKRADREQAARAASKRAALERDVESYQPDLERLQGELDGISEAAQRHWQRLEDERAFHRANDLRRAIKDTHSRAAASAAELGIEIPPAPVTLSPGE